MIQQVPGSKQGGTEGGRAPSPQPPWQGIIGTMRCCLLDIYKRKQNMVPTVIEQDDFDNFFKMISNDIKWYPRVGLIENIEKTAQNLKFTWGHVVNKLVGVKGSCSKTLVQFNGFWCKNCLVQRDLV